MKIRQRRWIVALLLPVLAVALWVLITSVVRERDDREAAAVADRMTSTYRKKFHLGETLAEVDSRVTKEHLPSVHRGNDEIFLVAQGGAAPWYCSHKYFGTDLKFTSGVLTTIERSVILEECL